MEYLTTPELLVKRKKALALVMAWQRSIKEEPVAMFPMLVPSKIQLTRISDAFYIPEEVVVAKIDRTLDGRPDSPNHTLENLVSWYATCLDKIIELYPSP